jgi:3-oxoacyl-[acyl-carrier protein] reductase
MSAVLRDKKAIVTGGSRGIGRAIAAAFLTEGAAVAICGRDPKQLEATAAELTAELPDQKIFTFTADVRSSEQVGELFRSATKQLGGLDILVNNAGVGIFRAVAELTIEEWDRVIGTNLSGAFYCTHEAVRHFDEKRGGSIINISSLAGKNPFAGGAAYNASKFGLNAMSEATMLDHRFDNVRVSYVLPGSVDTKFSGSDTARTSDWKIAPGDIAEIVMTILKMPERTLISRVEVRPSRPRKD